MDVSNRTGEPTDGLFLRLVSHALMSSCIHNHITSLLEVSSVEVLEEGLVTLCCSELHKEKPEPGWPRVLLACSVLEKWARTDDERGAARAAIERLTNAQELRQPKRFSNPEIAKQNLAFKKLIRRDVEIVPVSGDGDCLFRSVVHVVFNRRVLPKDLEDQFSMMLRKLCTKVCYNVAPEAEKRKYTKEEWDMRYKSEKGMSQHGTFADMAEVYKLAILLSLSRSFFIHHLNASRCHHSSWTRFGKC